MHMSLYQLNNELFLAEQMLEEWAEEHEGDITDFPLNEELDKLEMDRDTKALNVGVWYKNLLAQAEAIKDEVRVLSRRKQTMENAAARMKLYLQDNVPQGIKLENSRCKISWRKNTAVALPEGITPEELKKLSPSLTKTTVEFSKSAIGEEIKTGGLTRKKTLPGNVEVDVPYMEVETPEGKKFAFSIPQHKNIQVK